MSDKHWYRVSVCAGLLAALISHSSLKLAVWNLSSIARRVRSASSFSLCVGSASARFISAKENSVTAGRRRMPGLLAQLSTSTVTELTLMQLGRRATPESRSVQLILGLEPRGVWRPGAGLLPRLVFTL